MVWDLNIAQSLTAVLKCFDTKLKHQIHLILALSPEVIRKYY